MTAEQPAQFARDPQPAQTVRRLHRSTENRVLAGVCGGIAEYYGSDPTAVRLAVLVIGLFTGIFPMLILYLIAAIVFPERLPGETSAGAPARVRTGSAALVFGAILIIVGIGGFANEWLRLDWDLAWPLMLIGFGITVVIVASRRN